MTASKETIKTAPMLLQAEIRSGKVRKTLIKTVEHYLDSFHDGRQIWFLGEKVSDVRTHPTLSGII